MLSKREYLSGELKVSKKYQRVLEHRIKEKLKKFYMLELPLTQRLGVTEFSNNITEFSNTVKGKTTERANSFIKLSLERDSISRPNAYEAHLSYRKDLGISSKEKIRSLYHSYCGFVKSIDWEDYHKWLLDNKNRSHANQMYRYSKKYHSLPFTDELVAVKETRNRCDILKSTANLTRYLDIKNDTSFHEEFTNWMKKKELRWSIRNNSNNYFIANQISLEDVLGRIRKLPRKYRIFGMFVLVTGLRTEESMMAFNNHSKICHDGIMEMFWDRETKKTNAVYCHPKLHDNISYTINETGLRRNLKSSILGCEIRYLRKLNYTINATKIDPLLAEFMQGRRGNVSQRHYFLPLMNNNKKKWVRVWDNVVKSSLIQEV